jgi:nicotinate-nucleotide pyrophosphorylase (carboxylating)
MTEVIRRAINEDLPWGDITSETLIPEDATATAKLVAREPGVLAGNKVFAEVFWLINPSISVVHLASEGQTFEAGEVLSIVSGPARAILGGERVALNFVQRMSGIATQTAEYVAMVEGTNARITDTRKTTPGLREFEKYSVRMGGGHSHRFGLSDAIMAKDNHLAILTRGGKDLATELRRVRSELGHTTHIEVEVDRLDQIQAVLDGGADTIMLDNFSLEDLRKGVELIAGRATIEASGGVNLNTVRAIAETGVDVISVGALTHQIHSLDLGLDIEID